MQGLAEPADTSFGTVCGEQILREIVCADGKKVGMTGEDIDGQRRRRHFNHRSQGHARRSDAFPCQRVAGALENRAGRVHFGRRRHERQQDADVPRACRTENGAKLRLEHRRTR